MTAKNSTLTINMTTFTVQEYDPHIRRIPTIDGEGHEINGRHAYTLLACADDKGFRSSIEHDGSIRPAVFNDGERANSPLGTPSQYHADDIAANHGLPTEQMLDWLISLPKGKADLFIAFSFTSYDGTKIFTDLPYSKLVEFSKTNATEWRGFTITQIPHKFIRIEKDDRSIKIWDVFAYWQMKFTSALAGSSNLFNAEQQIVIDFIGRMKAERSNFDRMSEDEIKEYCYNECEYLSIMYRDLLIQLQELNADGDGTGLKPLRHSGPGAVAETFYALIKLKEYMPARNTTYTAGMPTDVAIMSMYGGRFETAILGEMGDGHEYDVQSAYPSIAVNLPCLAHGQFKRVRRFIPGKLGFYRAGSRTSGPWAPFPFRTNKETAHLLNNASKGSIAFVHGGRRWVTAFEVEKAIKYFGKAAIPIFDGWIWESNCNHKPFAELQRLYDVRKIGDPGCFACRESKNLFCNNHPKPDASLSKIIKLIINSVYGKLAQSIGWRFDTKSQFGIDSAQSYKPPVYQCYVWAAWMTGGTRAMVFEAAMIGGRNRDCLACVHPCKRHDEYRDNCDACLFRACADHTSIRSIATDGVLSVETIDDSAMPVTTWQLGTWEHTPKQDCWIGMPGIYSFRDFGKPSECKDCRRIGLACPNHIDAKKSKRRGLDGRYFPAEHLRSAWARGDWEVNPIGDADCKRCIKLQYACPKHPPIAFMPMKQGLARTNALEVIGEWMPTTKRVKFRSVMHKRNFPDDVDMIFPVHSGEAIRLDSITIPDDIESAPFEPKQSWEDVHHAWNTDPDIPIWEAKGSENATEPIQ